MAGAEAEMELLGKKAIGDGDDRYQIELMAERLCCSPPWEKLEPRLRAMNRMLVRRHRALIERIAKALLAKTTLTDRQATRQADRSKCRRLKCNAPLLKMMAEDSARIVGVIVFRNNIFSIRRFSRVPDFIFGRRAELTQVNCSRGPVSAAVGLAFRDRRTSPA
jgi:hypothetical protein